MREDSWEMERARAGERVKFSREAVEIRMEVISSWVGEESLGVRPRCGEGERLGERGGGGKE